MPLIGPGTPIASRQKRATCTVAGEPVPDGDGGYTLPDVPLNPPQTWVHIRPASARDLESITAGATVLAQATHIVTMPYHPQMTIEATLHVEHPPHADRRLTVIAIGNPDERNATLELVCAEVLGGTPS